MKISFVSVRALFITIAWVDNTKGNNELVNTKTKLKISRLHSRVLKQGGDPIRNVYFRGVGKIVSYLLPLAISVLILFSESTISYFGKLILLLSLKFLKC